MASVDNFTYSQKNLDLSFTRNELHVKAKNVTATFDYDDLSYQLSFTLFRDGWKEYYSITSAENTWTDPDTGEVLFGFDYLTIIHKDGRIIATLDPDKADYNHTDLKQISEKIHSKIQCWPPDNIAPNTFYYSRLPKLITIFILSISFLIIISSLFSSILVGPTTDFGIILVFTGLIGLVGLIIGFLTLETSQSGNNFPMHISKDGIAIKRKNLFIPFSTVLIDWFYGKTRMRIITPDEKIIVNKNWVKSSVQFQNVVEAYANRYRKKNWPPRNLEKKIFHYNTTNNKFLLLEVFLLLIVIPVISYLTSLETVKVNEGIFASLPHTFLIYYILYSSFVLLFVPFHFHPFRYRHAHPIIFSAEGLFFGSERHLIPWNNLEIKEGLASISFHSEDKIVKVSNGSLKDRFLFHYFLHAFMWIYNEEYSKKQT